MSTETIIIKDGDLNDHYIQVLGEGTQTNPFQAVQSLATNDTGRDAWGRPKVTNDNSIFHGMFTYNVPVSAWEESLNGTVLSAFSNATSVDGKLSLTAGGTANDLTKLRTFRNPRYEPNRGYIYSTSVFLPSPTADGERRFGFFTDESGVFFELDSVGLYAVVRTTISAVTSDDRYLIDTTGIDLSKGNLYDIQMQWRGVGNYKFYIGLDLVKEIEYSGTRDDLTIFNPANPLSFECKNITSDVTMFAGCVDATSEGGSNNGKSYGSVGISTEQGEAAFTGFNQPILAIRSKATVGALINTRDTLALLGSFYANEKAICRIWNTRDLTAITAGNSTWNDFGDGHLEYIEMNETAGTLAFDTAKADLIFTGRVAKENTYSTSALFEGRTSIYLTPGDMFIFTLHRETGAATTGGVTFEFAEEI